MPTELCAKCNTEPRGTHVSYCRRCWNAYQSQYRNRRYATEPEYRDKIRQRQRMRRYGVSDEEYAEMLAKQGGVCAICRRESGKKELGVDHNHTTGAVRGLLCTGCNRGLGMLGDDPELLRKAIDYLAIFDN